MLEATQYTENAFVTLTYSDENLPEDNSLVPKHAQDFLKRLRKKVEPVRLRFFLVGEYGDRTSRPHYHVALFGHPSCDRGRTDHRRITSGRSCCPHCDRVQQAWHHGGVDLGTLTPESAAYVSGYVTKKLTNKDDPYVSEQLNGRHPEFARMSLRPGIGAGFIEDLASTCLEFGLDTPDKLPSALRHGPKSRPLGSYLRNRLRERVGISKSDMTEYNVKKAKEELQPLSESAYTNTSAGFRAFAFKQKVIDAGTGKRQNLEAKTRIFKKRGTI